MWPDLTIADAAPRLHKLAHYARRALGDDRTAVILRGDTVALLPEADVVVDVDVFERVAEEALADGSAGVATAALERYGGTLLPDDLDETWAENRREHLRSRYRDLLRLAARWDALLADDPAAEDAHVALMTQHIEAGDHRAALRQFERMDAALRRDSASARANTRWPSATRSSPPFPNTGQTLARPGWSGAGRSANSSVGCWPTLRTGPAADTSGAFNLNGIAATPDGRTLIVGHSTAEALYTVDPMTGASRLLFAPIGPDGLVYEAGRLWVAEPFMNQVSRLRLSPHLTSGVVEEIITSPLFQTPSTVAIHGNRLAAVNAKFDTGFPPTADEYEVVIVDR